MGRITVYAKWKQLINEFLPLKLEDKIFINLKFIELDKNPDRPSEDSLQEAMDMWRATQAPTNMYDRAQEYDEIQQGIEIWASIQTNSGT